MGRNKKDDVERMEEMRLKIVNEACLYFFMCVVVVVLGIGVRYALDAPKAVTMRSIK